MHGQILEEAICSDIHIQANCSTGTCTVFQIVYPEDFPVIHKEHCRLILNLCFDMAPLSKSDIVDGCFVSTDAKFPEVTEGISRERKILAGMLFANGIGAVTAIGRTDIEGFKFAVAFIGSENNSDKTTGVGWCIKQKFSAHIHFNHAVMKIHIIQTDIRIRIILIKFINF